MASKKRKLPNDADMPSLQKAWDEVSCPICMDHPHNAVLIICSSHEKGCRSFICDTSYRHSNCLDRFKKLKQENTEALSSATSSQGIEFEGALHERPVSEQSNPSKCDEQISLKCPLCRGKVLGWKVVEDARKYLNLKPRSCSRESCLFCGDYDELRRHARRDHPMVRPADIDPSKQREWCRLEDETELNDIISAIQSAMPGAILVGDYAIESGNGLSNERLVFGSGSDSEHGRWLSTLFLYRMLGSLEAAAPRQGSRARGMSGIRRSGRAYRRFLWGETLLGLQDYEEHLEDAGDRDGDDEQHSSAADDDGGGDRRREPRIEQDEADEDNQQ